MMTATRTKSKKQSSASIEKIIRKQLKKHKTPLMLIRRSVLIKQYQTFKSHLPNVEVYYAIKANPHVDIIKTFANLGSNFDVASATEMNTVLNLGIAPERIIFANPIKSVEDLKEARKRRVKFMVFDNEAELYKIQKHCPGASVLIRLKVGNVGSIVELSLKFGAEPDQAVFLLQKAKSLGLKPIGISFHVGSQCTNAENYLQALEVSSAIFEECRKHNLALSVLDIGGGFPIRHFDRDTHPDFEVIARQIKSERKRLFHKEVKMIAEPGRYLSGPAGILITQVVGRTFRNNKNYYYLNDGIYGDFSGIVFDHCKYEFKTLRRGQKFLSTLAGPTCDSFDTISISEELPELDVGNVIYVKSIGAYSSASGDTKFNGFPPAKAVLID